jgi:formimidoylglutamate deiminase
MKNLSRAILPADCLYEAASNAGARSLGFTADPADYFTIDLNHPSLAGWNASDFTTQLLFSVQLGAIRDVFVAGKQVIAEGRHLDQDQIIAGFVRVQKRLWQ